MYLDLHLHAYKDHSQRRRYVEWVLKQQMVDGYFSNKVFSSDEAHLTLCGYGNKQSCRIWDPENPHVFEDSNFSNLLLAEVTV